MALKDYSDSINQAVEEQKKRDPKEVKKKLAEIHRNALIGIQELIRAGGVRIINPK